MIRHWRIFYYSCQHRHCLHKRLECLAVTWRFSTHMHFPQVLLSKSHQPCQLALEVICQAWRQWILYSLEIHESRSTVVLSLYCTGHLLVVQSGDLSSAKYWHALCLNQQVCSYNALFKNLHVAYSRACAILQFVLRSLVDVRNLCCVLCNLCCVLSWIRGHASFKSPTQQVQSYRIWMKHEHAFQNEHW